MRHVVIGFEHQNPIAPCLFCRVTSSVGVSHYLVHIRNGLVDGRTLPEGNGDQPTAVRTQSRVAASNVLIAVRRANVTMWMRRA